MNLLYSATIEPSGNKTLTVPFGVKRCKMRSSTQVPVIVGIGPISSSAFNTITDFEFTIINGQSPNTFTTSFSGTETITIYLLVEEIGGTPDPEYFTREVAQSE